MEKPKPNFLPPPPFGEIVASLRRLPWPQYSFPPVPVQGSISFFPTVNCRQTPPPPTTEGYARASLFQWSLIHSASALFHFLLHALPRVRSWSRFGFLLERKNTYIFHADFFFPRPFPFEPALLIFGLPELANLPRSRWGCLKDNSLCLFSFFSSQTSFSFSAPGLSGFPESSIDSLFQHCSIYLPGNSTFYVGDSPSVVVLSFFLFPKGFSVLSTTPSFPVCVHTKCSLRLSDLPPLLSF